jgi:queuine/archaeosine tRNA-ribosyltransferase
MFQLDHLGQNGIRFGRFCINGKEVDSPSPFAISNIGGGQSDVDRLISYIDIFYSTNTPLLFNFYYLTRGGRFVVKWTREIESNEDILDFVLRQSGRLRHTGRISTEYQRGDYSSKTRPLVLLDSGSGDFLRDFARQGYDVASIRKEFQKLVPEILTYASVHKFDIVIGLDYASKNTYRDKETEDKQYTGAAAELVNSKRDNLNLLELNLTYLKDEKRSFLLYAPIHGDSLSSYADFCQNVLAWEDQEKVRFDGFALGGLSPRLASTSWRVPSGCGRLMSTWYLYYFAGKTVRDLLTLRKDTRPIHGLGLGAAKNVIPLVLAGVDTFDAHTPWRRAIDGSHSAALRRDPKGSYSKYLIPVFSKDGSVYDANQTNCWHYEKLPQVDDSTKCDCPVCSKYPASRLKQLYFSRINEEYYLSRILLYCHAIFQAKHTCKALVSAASSNERFKHFVETLPLEFRQGVTRLLQRTASFEEIQ